MTQWRWIAAGFAGLALGLNAAAAMAETRTLSGMVIYRERIALPPSAVVEVKLVDISLADAPSRTIAEMKKPARARFRYPTS
ncbi:YbaY family lipoprotein [Phreatobacter sp.]|uniref:YbaY family lipoprotein n=1 Tax=Phreatobacter sp. TaxID=1966341 RepID=UPI00345D5DC7